MTVLSGNLVVGTIWFLGFLAFVASFALYVLAWPHPADYILVLLAGSTTVMFFTSFAFSIYASCPECCRRESADYSVI